MTGTLTGGALAVDDELVLLPPGAARCGSAACSAPPASATAVGPGNRVAVNLVGVAHDEVERGDALVRPGQWHPTRRVDASLDVLAALDHEVTRRGAYVAYIGSGEHPVRLRVLGADAHRARARPGLVRLHLPVPLPAAARRPLRAAGERAGSETVGGGEVLDVAPGAARRPRRRPTARSTGSWPSGAGSRPTSSSG